MEYSHFISRYHRRRKYIDHDYRKHFGSQITWWFVWNKEMGICSVGVSQISRFPTCRSGDEASSMVSLSSLCVRARLVVAAMRT